MARRRSKGTRDNSRSASAQRGWETRRANARSASARRGWETRRAKESKRSEAARKGWETRRARTQERVPIQPAPGVYFDPDLGLWVYPNSETLMREAEQAESRAKWTAFPGDLSNYLDDIAGKAYFVIVQERRDPGGPMLFRPYFVPEAWKERAAFTSEAEELRTFSAPETSEALEYF